MSQHPSLKLGASAGKFRSVIKRHEKVKELAEKDKWDEEKNSVYKLPKVKRILFKIKKSKSADDEEGAGETKAADAEGAEGKSKPEDKK